MSAPYIASNVEPVSTDLEWATVVDTNGETVNWFTVANEGDEAGFWRLVFEESFDATGQRPEGMPTKEARLFVGGGEPGSRRAGFNIPCPDFSGKLQVRASGVGQRVTGIFAWGMK